MIAPGRLGGRSTDNSGDSATYLSALSAVRWYCETVENPPELAVWLPFETPNGPPVKRNMKAFLFQQAKPIWEMVPEPEGRTTKRDS